MGIVKEKFGTTKTGEDVYAYTLSNASGMKAKIINYGANIVSLFVPDKDGNLTDVVLGYDTLEGYYRNGSFFGATIGPSANRIAGACFEIDGRTYHIDVNDGENNLHSHMEEGYHKRLWEAQEGEDALTLTLEGKDGELGFPGNKKAAMTFTLSDDNALKLSYHVTSDADTIVNLTNHTYFNLDGHDSGRIEEHEHGANHGDGHGGRHGGGTEPEKEDEAGDGAESSAESPALQPTEQDTEQPAGQDTDRHREEGHGHRSGHGR